MKEKIYIVLDESGAMHQKNNNYFIIGGFLAKNLTIIKSKHKKIERFLKLKYPTLNKYKELKGCYLRENQKFIFLNEILKLPNINVISIIVDKSHITNNQKKHNENIKYNYFVHILLSYLLHNYPNKLKNNEIYLILDNRNVSVGSLNSLEDYLNSSLGLIYNKVFKVVYKNSLEHREVQVADLICNALFGCYNKNKIDYILNKVPSLKKAIISKFPYMKFEEPKKKEFVKNN